MLMLVASMVCQTLLSMFTKSMVKSDILLQLIIELIILKLSVKEMGILSFDFVYFLFDELFSGTSNI